MVALVYPDSLPCPQRAPYQRAERRSLSSVPGKRNSRTLWRDRYATEPVQFLLTFEQAATWLAWITTDLIEGGAWFAATWRLPSGRDGVYRFTEAPSYPEFVPLVGWRVSANVAVRGRGMAPQSHRDCFNETTFDLVDRYTALSGTFVPYSVVGETYGATLRCTKSSTANNNSVVARTIPQPRLINTMRALFQIRSIDTDDAMWVEAYDAGVVKAAFQPRRETALDSLSRAHCVLFGTDRPVGSAALATGTWYEVLITIASGAGNSNCVVRNHLTGAVVASTTFPLAYDPPNVDQLRFVVDEASLLSESDYAQVHIC